MWRIGHKGLTLQEVLTMAYMNVLAAELDYGDPVFKKTFDRTFALRAVEHATNERYCRFRARELSGAPARQTRLLSEC